MKTVRNWLKVPARGQSLVEMAITAPILIFMLIGVFEVGWALRGYLVLVNANREITRFAVRPGYLDFSTQTEVISSYNRVRGWVDTAVTEQLPLDFDESTGNSTLIVSHIVVDTGQPCDGSCNPADCDKFDPDHGDYDPIWVANNEFKADNIVIHPDDYAYQAARFGPTQTVTGQRDTRQDYSAITQKLQGKNNAFNCKVLGKGGVSSANNIIITELFYDQPQLFGFPLISNPYTDPVPLYTHTAMRLVSAARSTGTAEGHLTAGISTIGPVCFVHPMVIDETVGHNQTVDIVEHGWLKWGNLVADNGDYMELAVAYPQLSLNDYPQPGGIQLGRSVPLVSLTEAQEDEVRDELDELVGQRIIIPTAVNPSAPVVADFVWATIQNYDLGPGSSHQIMATIDRLTPLPEACVP